MLTLNDIQQNVYDVCNFLAERNDLKPPRIGGWITLSDGTMLFIEGKGTYKYNGEKFQWILL